eukprot:1833849-Alexandrium_andersonii.AAC.1
MESRPFANAALWHRPAYATHFNCIMRHCALTTTSRTNKRPKQQNAVLGRVKLPNTVRGVRRWVLSATRSAQSLTACRLNLFASRPAAVMSASVDSTLTRCQ